MTILKIILIMLGITAIMFGYEIYFKKKYNLINSFKEDYKNGRKTELYAKKVGLIEFVLGIALLLTSIYLIVIQ